jgi:hypothetical protein
MKTNTSDREAAHCNDKIKAAENLILLEAMLAKGLMKALKKCGVDFSLNSMDLNHTVDVTLFYYENWNSGNG